MNSSPLKGFNTYVHTYLILFKQGHLKPLRILKDSRITGQLGNNGSSSKFRTETKFTPSLDFTQILQFCPRVPGKVLPYDMFTSTCYQITLSGTRSLDESNLNDDGMVTVALSKGKGRDKFFKDYGIDLSPKEGEGEKNEICWTMRTGEDAAIFANYTDLLFEKNALMLESLQNLLPINVRFHK